MIGHKISWRTRMLWCLFAAAFGCFPDWDLDDTEPLPSGGDAGETDAGTEHYNTVTIATYNVEDFDLGQAAAGQYGYIAAFAKDNSVDIMAVQEVQQDENGDDEALFTAALENASYPMPYRGFSSMSDGFNSLAVWSRFPLSDFEEILSSNTRIVYRFTANADGVEMLFFACHLKSGDDAASSAKRQEEARLIEAYIVENRDPVSENIVLLGDMNTMSNSDFVVPGTLSSLSLKSNNPQNTADDFTPVNYTELPESRTDPAWESILDHILLSPSAMAHYVSGSVRICTPDGDGPFGPSDHYPVLLDLLM